MRLGDCRGIVEAVNMACTCGGNGPGEGCPECEVYHAIADMELSSAEETRAACEKAWSDGRDSAQVDLGAADRSPNPYAKRG